MSPDPRGLFRRPVSPVLQLLKKSGVPFIAVDDLTEIEKRDVFSGIRCPLCHWRPTRSDVWACESLGTPEPFFGGCGTVWNTFSTRGRCPGCAHQWRWTSCHACHGWAPHEDWYFTDDD